MELAKLKLIARFVRRSIRQSCLDDYHGLCKVWKIEEIRPDSHEERLRTKKTERCTCLFNQMFKRFVVIIVLYYNNNNYYYGCIMLL